MPASARLPPGFDFAPPPCSRAAKAVGGSGSWATILNPFLRSKLLRLYLIPEKQTHHQPVHSQTNPLDHPCQARLPSATPDGSTYGTAYDVPSSSREPPKPDSRDSILVDQTPGFSKISPKEDTGELPATSATIDSASPVLAPAV